ncbi:MAG: hypothetical protein L6R42_009747 [Xanthoria sp. 1 TBL-2021]|nr:MAG: hypothetical protein L6R42_009747 [Xanthoria sp. 1 TBL-2021]
MADEKQPSCSACQRLGVTCPGPQERTTFIQEYPNQRRKAPSGPAALGSSTHAPPLSQQASTTSPPYLAAQTWLSGRSLHAAQRWNLTLPKEAYYTTLFVSKFNNTVPAGVWSPFSWLNYGVLADNGDATISHRFAQNLTQAFFAHYFALPRVMNAAQVGYGRNLLMLKESLDLPEMIASEDLFHGILTAVIFELITQTSSSAWIVHIIALAKIIETGFSIMHRKRTFFDNPQWRLIISQQFPSGLLPRLADIHIQVPGLLEDFDNLCCSEAAPSVTYSTLNHLRDQTIGLINSLFAWRWEWERQHADQVWEIPCPLTSQVPTDKTTGKTIYSTRFEFSNYLRLGEIGRYNGILCILLNLLRDICGDDDDDAPINLLDRRTPTDLLYRAHRSPLCLPSDPELSPRNAGAEHIRSVEKALDKEMHVSSTGLILVMMLNLTYKALPAGDPLRLWIQRIYWNINSASGTKMRIKDVEPEGKSPHPLHWKRLYLPPSGDQRSESKII